MSVRCTRRYYSDVVTSQDSGSLSRALAVLPRPHETKRKVCTSFQRSSRKYLVPYDTRQTSRGETESSLLFDNNKTRKGKFVLPAMTLPRCFFFAACLLVLGGSSVFQSSGSDVLAFSATQRTRTGIVSKTRHTPLTAAAAAAAAAAASTPTTSAEQNSLDDHHEKTLSEPPCYWKPTWEKSRWQRRIHLEDVRVGQKLQGTITQELLDGRTGPKLFFEVGVGRTDSKGNWTIVNAMLRLNRAKESVTKKRAARLRKKESVELWVSRIQKDCTRLEVCLDEEEAMEKYQSAEPKIPVSSLSKGTEVKGKIVRILPYGVMVDVGANRHGLLHIKKVRQLYGKYIDKEKGLTESGLERGANVRLCVESIDKRRLSLDFTEDVKSEAQAELEAEAKAELEAASLTTDSPMSKEVDDSSVESEDESSSMSEQELAEWAAFASAGDNEVVVDAGSQDSTDEDVDDDDEEEEEDEDEYDEYDEERDIEDSLGLGFY
jgi:predicted RNA-binding protein with RPS1 domain